MFDDEPIEQRREIVGVAIEFLIKLLEQLDVWIDHYEYVLPNRSIGRRTVRER
jgi:hypothetical protein